MKTGEELYCKVHQSPRLPGVLHLCRTRNTVGRIYQLQIQEKSRDWESEEHKYREACSSSRVDFRIPGIPHSTVEQVETNRKETVGRLIEQFETSPKQEYVAERLWEVGGDQPFQSRIKGFDHWIEAMPRSSSSTRLLRRDSVQIAPCIGKLVSDTAHAENAYSLRKRVDNSTKTDLTYCRFLDTWCRRTNPSGVGMVNHCVKQCIPKPVMCWEKPKMQRMVIAKLFLNSGLRTQNIARICLNMDGQKNKSDNPRHLQWKIIPMKLHLKNGDDGRRSGTLFFE